MKKKATRKAKPVYAVETYLAHRLADDAGFEVFPTGITKDGVAVLDDTARAAALAAYEALMDGATKFTVDPAHTPSEEEQVALEDAKLAALDKFRAAQKAVKAEAKAVAKAEKLAQKSVEAEALLAAGQSPEPAAAPDPLREARLVAFRALAEDLGVQVDKKAKSAFIPSAKDARKAAARFAIKQAADAVSVKVDEPLTTEAMAKLQLAHDAMALLCEGTCCPASAAADGAPVAAAATSPAMLEAMKTLDFTGLSTALANVQKSFVGETDQLTTRLAEAQAQVTRIETTIKDLANMPLGRPTQANTRVVADPNAATWADMATAGGSTPSAQTPIASDDLLKGTEIVMVKRGQREMKMRKWPAGYAAGQRPAIPDAVKPYMLMQHLVAYNDGGEAFVPELTD